MPYVVMNYLQVLSRVARGLGIIKEQEVLLDNISKEMNSLAEVWKSADHQAFVQAHEARDKEIRTMLSTLRDCFNEMRTFATDVYELDYYWSEEINKC